MGTQADLRFLVRPEARAGGYEVPKNHVFLQSDQVVDLAGQRGFRKDLRCLLETGGGQKAPALHGRLGNSQQLGGRGCRFGPLALGGPAAVGFELGVLLFKNLLGDDVAFLEFRVAGIGDLDTAGELLVLGAEFELVDHAAFEQAGVAARLDADLAQHLRDDDLDVFVVDVDTLAAVDVLDFTAEVLLEGLFAGDSQDVVGDERPVDEGLAGSDEVTGVHAEVLPVGHEVLAFDPRFAADDDRPLAAAFFAENFHAAVDFGDHRRVFRLARLEDFRHPRQPAGDVLRAGDFARRLGQQGAGRDVRPLLDFDVRLFRHVVKVENLPVRVFEDDLRVEVPLVLHDQAADRSAHVALEADRLAFDDVLEADAAADFGEDWNAVRVPVAQRRSDRDFLVLVDQEEGARRDVVFFHLAPLGVDDGDLSVAREDDLLAFVVADGLEPSELDNAGFLRPELVLLHGPCRRAADMEGPHRQLGARFADALRGDDPHGHALLDGAAGRKVHAVAQDAHAQRRVAGHRAADLDLLQSQLLDPAGDLAGDQLVLADDDFVGDRVDDVRPADAAADRVGQADFDFFAAIDHALGNPLGRAAVMAGDHHVLSHVGQFARQVSGVGRLQGRVGQSLASAVGRAEILQHAQALAEIRLDRRLDDLARRLGHQAAHPGELANLLDSAASARVGHQVDRVDVAGPALVGLQLVHHFDGDLLPSVGPGVEHLVVPLALGDDPALIELENPQHVLLGVADDLRLARRRDQIVAGERQAAPRALAEPQLVHAVEQVDRPAASENLVAIRDHGGQRAAPHRVVVVGHAFGEHGVEDHAADGRVENPAVAEARVVLDLAAARQADLDHRVGVDLAERIGELHLPERGERHSIAAAVGLGDRQVVAPHHDVLRGADDRRAVGGTENVVRRHQQRVRLDLGFDRQGQVDRHLVAVEVGVEALADQRVQLDRVALDERRLEGLDAHPVQRRSAVQQHGVVADHLFENVPDLLVLPFEHLLGALDRVGVLQLLEPPDDERLVELQGDLLGQPALVQAEVRPDHDHAASRVIDALAEQVLAEPALLALDHVRQRLERAVARSEHGALAAVVVEQGVDRLLEHPFLVLDDHLRRVQVDELLQPVVAVDDPPVEVVQVAGGKIARIEEHERAEVRRDHRDHVEHHPLGAVVAVADRFDDLQAVDQVLFLLLRVGLVQFAAEVAGELHQVQVHQQPADRLGAHVGLEGPFRVFRPRFAVFLLGQQLVRLERGVARVGDDVVLEVDNLLQARGLHAQEGPQAARHGLEEPDVDDRRGQFDVPHPLAANAAVGDLDAAAVADHPLVLHAAVLAASALPVLLRTENPLAEEAVLLRPVGPVVDRLRLLDLAEGPAPNVVGPGKADLDGSEIVDAFV